MIEGPPGTGKSQTITNIIAECLAAGRPTVATPVAGFRELGPPVVVVDRDGFVGAVSRALDPSGDGGGPDGSPPEVATWSDRAQAMLAVMTRVRSESATA